jgi:hypothetical protein
VSGLIERIEAGGGPDRVIDGWIWAIIKGDDPYVVGNEPGRFPQKAIMGTRLDVMRELDSKDGADYIGAPPFTASIDAALKLVEADWFWRVGHDGEGADPSLFRADVGEPVSFGFVRAVAATPALALCAAALRARETTPSIKGGDRG